MDSGPALFERLSLSVRGPAFVSSSLTFFHLPEHDAQQKQRQGFPEFVRDSFTQQFGLQSVAKTKLVELVHFCQSEVLLLPPSLSPHA
jgi:hypothetical protein